MKKRIYEYDNLKAILIFLVVLGHLLISFTHETSETARIISSFIYSFHMPLFFIISGYFSSKKLDKTSILKLLLIFLIMNISFSIYDYFIIGKLQLFGFKYASWYILLLLIYRLVINNKIVKSLIKEKEYIFIIISILLSIFIPLINTELFILRIFENWIYFLVGYLLIDKENIIASKIDKKYLYLLLIFLLTICFYIGNIYQNNLGFFLGNSYAQIKDIIPKFILIISNILLLFIIKELMYKKELPIISNIGKQSLYIYMLHRIPTLILSELIIPDRKLNIIIDVVLAFILCLILSSKIVVKTTDFILNNIIKIIKNKKMIITLIIILLITFSLINILNKNNETSNNKNDTITINFIGDLILLEDQVKLSKTKLSYDFDYMFKYTKKYFKNDDYTIGIFEGPSDDNQNYSVGNYNDNNEIRINHPGKFINSIKEAGIDLVSTANNHVYDKGYLGEINTIKNLKDRGLNFIGTGTEENPQRKIVNIDNKKVGLLAYTFFSNFGNDTYNKDLVKFLCDPNSDKFNEAKESIKADFEYLNKENVDLIIVLPHYGTEFNFDFNSYQEKWNSVFEEFGANIILGDHSHVIGPIKYYNDTLAISSPGNYVNSYNGQDSDLSNIIEIVINKDDNKIKEVNVIPMLAIKEDKGFLPISLYDLSKKDKDNERVKQTLSIFGSVMFNNENIELKEKYNVEKVERNIRPLELQEQDKESKIYKLIDNSNKVCFIGDSITEGTMNNYHPWYEPLMDNFNKDIDNISKGSYTTTNIIEDFKDNIEDSNCDLTFINIGTNDIRYSKTNEKEYIKNIKQIISYIDKDSNIVLISPWETYSNDKIIGDYILEKKDLYGRYNKELIKISEKSDRIYYINPIRYIKSYIMIDGEEKYLLDGVHPNEDIGIKLYSYGVLRGSRY